MQVWHEKHPVLSSSNMKSKTIWSSDTTFMYILSWTLGLDVWLIGKEILPMSKAKVLNVLRD